MRFEIYKAHDGWRWRFLARNGEIIACGEAYKNKTDCFGAVKLIRTGADRARIEYPQPVETQGGDDDEGMQSDSGDNDIEPTDPPDDMSDVVTAEDQPAVIDVAERENW